MQRKTAETRDTRHQPGGNERPISESADSFLSADKDCSPPVSIRQDDGGWVKRVPPAVVGSSTRGAAKATAPRWVAAIAAIGCSENTKRDARQSMLAPTEA
jgi:hypothetical protein